MKLVQSEGYVIYGNLLSHDLFEFKRWIKSYQSKLYFAQKTCKKV